MKIDMQVKEPQHAQPDTAPVTINELEYKGEVWDDLLSISLDGPSTIAVTLPPENKAIPKGDEFSTRQIEYLQKAVEKAAKAHDAASTAGTDTLDHRGVMRSYNAFYLLKNIDEIMNRNPVNVKGTSYTTDQVIGLVKQFLPAVRRFETNDSARKDFQVKSMDVLNLLIEKAGRKEPLSALQANTLGKAVAEFVSEGAYDNKDHGRQYSKQVGRSWETFGGSTVRVIDNIVRMKPKSKDGTNAVLGYATALATAPLSLAAAAADAAVLCNKKDKTHSHALALLRTAVKQIPKGQIDNDVFNTCMSVLMQTPEATDATNDHQSLHGTKSYHNDLLRRALKDRVTPEQMKMLDDVVQKEARRTRVSEFAKSIGRSMNPMSIASKVAQSLPRNQGTGNV